MKKLMVLMAIILLSGCNFFTVSTPKEMKIPEKPERTFEQKEDFRKEVGIISDIAQVADHKGIDAKSTASNTLLASSKVIQTVVGLPTEPVNWQNEKEVRELHIRVLEQEKELRTQKDEWELKINSLANEKTILQKENGFLKTLVDKFKFWFWTVTILLGVLCFFLPTIGIPLVKFLLGRVKKAGEVAVVETASALKSQMGQVVSAIEVFKLKNPDIAEPLLSELHKKTDTGTRKLIKELKN
jgi:hypothetical protein